MAEPKANLRFRLMTLVLKMRDIFRPPEKILKAAGIRPGMQVLDFGCGPGSFTMAAARLVGQSGKVYALDLHALAIQKIKKRASQEGLGNIETIHSDLPRRQAGCATGLKDASVDMVLSYDMLHEVEEPDKVLAEVHRVLKPDGVLSFSDHHLKEDWILFRLENKGLFKLAGRGKKTYQFCK